MSWHEFSANWTQMIDRLKERFPEMRPGDFSAPPRDSRALTQHLAETHDLTLFEAKEELHDFLYVEGLSRAAHEMHLR